MTAPGAYVLETERLGIRPYDEHDRSAVVGLLTDPRTTTYYPRPYTDESANRMFDRMLASHAADGSGLHVIELRGDGAFVGHCGPMWQEVDGRVFLEVGWMVLPGEWGNGYAPEAGSAWHGALAERFGVDHTASIIGLRNRPSQRVAEKLGLRRGTATTFRGSDVELWSRTLDAARVEIRDARAGDERGIAFAHVRCWQWAYRGLLPQAMLDGLDIDARTERWTRILGSDRPAEARTLVAVRGDVVLAFADVAPSRDEDAPPGTFELTSIYQRPDMAGTGTGAALLAAAADAARDAGARRMTLWALATNERALRAYRRAGWRPDGATKVDVCGIDHDGVTVDEVRWEITLG